MRAGSAKEVTMANLLVRRRSDPLSPFYGDWMEDLWNRAGIGPRYAEMPSVERALMDVVDNGDHFSVRLDMPGVKKEDIEVSIEGSHVAVRAETRSTKEDKEGERVLHTERFAAMYARSFELPSEVSEAGAEARYENGVLTLMLPKRDKLAGRKLTIN
jgi:HSP20 family protein